MTVDSCWDNLTLQKWALATAIAEADLVTVLTPLLNLMQISYVLKETLANLDLFHKTLRYLRCTSMM